MQITAVVLSWNGREDTLACLESLEGVDTVVVDNGSADGSPEAIEERFPDVELIRAGVNLGFAAGCNVGIRRALDQGADWVVLVNNDSTVAPDLVDALTAAAARHPDAGALAGKVYVADPPDVIWYAGGSFEPRVGYSGRVRGSGKPDDGASTRSATSIGAPARSSPSHAARSTTSACSTRSSSPTSRTSTGACGSATPAFASSSYRRRGRGIASRRPPAAPPRPRASTTTAATCLRSASGEPR